MSTVPITSKLYARLWTKLGDVWRYTDSVFGPQPAPTLTAVSPASAPAGSTTTVTVTGKGFRQGASIAIGPTQATGVTVDALGTSISGTVTLGTAATVDVVVQNPDGKTGGLPHAFAILAPPGALPVISSLSPSQGSVSGGTLVTAYGAGFVPQTTVTVDGVAATNVTVINSATTERKLSVFTKVQRPNSAGQRPRATHATNGKAAIAQGSLDAAGYALARA